MAIDISSELMYFLGLITGRGSFEKNKKIIVLEFDYAKPLEGIPFCPKCQEIVKGISNKKCSTHGIVTPKFNVGPFDQQLETEQAIDTVVIPIIAKLTDVTPTISHAKTAQGGKSFISYDLSSENELCDWIFSKFSPFTNFDSFEIPSFIYDLEIDLLKEFVSGVADCAGFPKWANFAPAFQFDEDKDRARAYFQFVRNWKLPVQFCRILQDCLSIPVDTIRWGHPNIVDGSLKDFDESGYTAMREHQLKIFAEYFDPEFHKFEYKKLIHEELSIYNKGIGFVKNDQCIPPKSRLRVKSYHPLENHPQIPSQIREQHFDAFWQICWKMGCNRCQNISGNNPEYVYQTGKDEDFSGEIQDVKNVLHNRRISKLDRARSERPEISTNANVATNPLTPSESDTYPILQRWLENYLRDQNNGEIIISEIVATKKLSNLPSLQPFPEIIDLVEKLEIRPDVVGFVNDSKMTFIESKIDAISLSNVGQLLGYCMIANPDSAYLISTKPISAALTLILSTYEELLEYNGKMIQIGQLDMNSGIVTMVV
jgi:hypothetical protein